MAIQIGANMDYQGKNPNFERDSFKTLELMKNYPETSLDEGHMSFCEESGKRYEFKSGNDNDPITGKWRPVEGGSPSTEKEIVVKSNVGCIEKDKVYPIGTKIGDIIDDLLSGDSSESVKDIYFITADNTTFVDLTDFGLTHFVSIPITTDNKHVIFVYDKSYGELTQMKEDNGFNVLDDFTKSEVKIESKEYLVYTSKYKYTCVNYSYKLIF